MTRASPVMGAGFLRSREKRENENHSYIEYQLLILKWFSLDSSMTTERKIPDSYLVPISALKACKLWEGSHEQMSFKFTGLLYGHVCTRIDQLEISDDRTPNEDSWLAALKTAKREAEQIHGY